MLNISPKQRDLFCEAILQTYSIDEELKSFLKKPILDYANSNLSEQALNRMLDEKMSIYNNINTLKTNINIFSGYIYEFLCSYDYNMHRNKDHILTILNPDSSSKTDLLHIIKTLNGYVVVPGGDVKSGSPRYVLDQYEKLLKTKYDIPFIDYSGYLTTNKHLLSPKQLRRLEKLFKEYPNKRPVEATLSSTDINKIKVDILAYFETGYLPTERISYGVKFEIDTYNKNREARENLVSLAISRKSIQKSITWSTYKYQSNVNLSNTEVDLPLTDTIDYSEQKSDVDDKFHEEFTDYYSYSQEDENEREIRNELERLEKKKPTYELNSEKSLPKKLWKVLKTSVKLIDFHFTYNELITELKQRIDSNNFTQGLEEIHEVIEERNREQEAKYSQEYEDEEDYYYEENDSYYEDTYYYEENDSYYEDTYNSDINQNTETKRTSPSTHDVRAHSRTLKDGRVISVRAHQRGRKN